LPARRDLHEIVVVLCPRSLHPSRRGLAVAGSTILTATAATYIVPSDDALIRKSGSVVRGRVVDVRSVELPDGAIETRTTIDVARVLKGQIGVSRVVVRQPGGEVGDRAEVYPGIGGFAVDEQVLVMLDAPVQGLYRVTDFALGNFTVLTASDGSEILRRQGLKDAFLLESHGRGPAVESGRGRVGLGSGLQPHRVASAQRISFPDRRAGPGRGRLRALRHRGERGTLARADYVLPEPKPTSDVFAAFTFLGNPPARWTQFDSQTPVVYKDNASGDPGSLCSNGCHGQVAQARPSGARRRARRSRWSTAGRRHRRFEVPVQSQQSDQLQRSLPRALGPDVLFGNTRAGRVLELRDERRQSRVRSGHPGLPQDQQRQGHDQQRHRELPEHVRLHVDDHARDGSYDRRGHSGNPNALMAPFLVGGICGTLQPTTSRSPSASIR
jgi:hypothetical protein